MIRTILFLAFFSCTTLSAQFAWQEISIPVRDGQSLAADLYTTTPASAKPVVLVQTPYNKNFYRIGTQLPPQAGSSFPLDTAAFNYVILDWRGFYGSKDAAVQGYDRGLDGYDVVEWIATQPWCNGKVGTWGPSALGAIQFQTARRHPPHLVCAVPMVKDFKTKYEDYYYGGEYRKAHVEALQKLGFLSTDLILVHPTNDLFIQIAEQGTDYPEELAVPMLMIGGWFDHYPDDVIRAFQDIKERSDVAVRGKHHFLIGPWTHSGIDQAAQGELEYPNAVGVANDAALQFFRYYLLDEQNGWEATPPVRYYQLGANEWRTTNDWNELTAQANTTNFYLRKDGILSTVGIGGPSFEPDSFVADPGNPSPTYGGSYFDPFDRNAAVGPYDQREVVESRSDALLYTTAPLQENLDVNGPIAVNLLVSSNREDTDFGVRLCDVYPDGRSILLTQGIQRMRFRNGFRPQDTSLIMPGEQYQVTVALQNLAVTFLKGHRIRIIITGSNYPHFDVNPNTAAPLYKSPDSVPATNLVYLAPDNPDYLPRLILPTMKTSSLAAQQATGVSFGLNITPNPISTGGSIRFTLNGRSHVRLTLYDVVGKEVAIFTEGIMEGGAQSIPFTGANDLPSGIYFCQLNVDGKKSEKNVVVISR